MTIQLSEAEVQTISSMRAQAQSGAIGYWQIYKWLADNLQSKGVSATDSTVLWLRGATEANAGRGAFSELIRVYTETEYRLRYGSLPSAAQMQTASDSSGSMQLVFSPDHTLTLINGAAGNDRYQFADGRTLATNELVGSLSETVTQATNEAGITQYLGGRNADAITSATGLATISGGQGNDTQRDDLSEDGDVGIKDVTEDQEHRSLRMAAGREHVTSSTSLLLIMANRAPYKTANDRFARITA